MIESQLVLERNHIIKLTIKNVQEMFRRLPTTIKIVAGVTLLVALALFFFFHHMDDAISPERALRSPDMSQVSVKGFLLIDTMSGEQKLCTELFESFPPQCAGTSLEVRGNNLSGLPALQREGDIIWSPEPILLSGYIREAVLWLDESN